MANAQLSYSFHEFLFSSSMKKSSNRRNLLFHKKPANSLIFQMFSSSANDIKIRENYQNELHCRPELRRDVVDPFFMRRGSTTLLALATFYPLNDVSLCVRRDARSK